MLLRWLVVSALVAEWCDGVLALTQFEALQVVGGFAEKFLAPHNAEVAASMNSTLFAEDVTGTVDLSTNFDGRELSTEYLFGLFVQNDLDLTDPSPFGVPIGYNVTHVVVQNAHVASSIVFDFYYRSLDRTFPIQVDSFILVNDRKQIQQYDAVFRRWAWATDTIIPLLIPHMAAKLGLQSTNSTDILRQYLVQKVCDSSTKYCKGSNQQYSNHESCVSFLSGIDIGEWYRMGEDNLLCRHLHVGMLPLRPQVHCPHIGPTGGDMCVKRDYVGVVTASRFPAGWLAPKIVTPGNAARVAGIHATNGTALDPLLEIAMSKLDTTSWDPSIYAIALLGYMLAFYLSAKILFNTFHLRSPVFRSLDLEHQKNVVIYALHTVYTTLALGLQLASTPAVAGTLSLRAMQYLRTAAVLVSSIYCFELIYRVQMRVPMIIHHFLTIFVMSWTVALFEYTSSTTYMISGFIWLFQATTEQLTFLALLGYRLQWPIERVSRLLKFAAVQSFVVKSASAISLLVYWGLHQNYNYRPIDLAWSILLFSGGFGLVITQVWGSYVTFSITPKSGGLEIRLENNLEDTKSPYTLYDSSSCQKSTAITISTLTIPSNALPPHPSATSCEFPSATTHVLTPDDDVKGYESPVSESDHSVIYLRSMDSSQRSVSPRAMDQDGKEEVVQVEWADNQQSRGRPLK